MAKHNPFLEARYLNTGAADIQRRFDNFQKVTKGDKQQVAEGLGEIISAFNFLHPFRECNGRTQRILALAMAKEKGFVFSIEPDTDMYQEYMKACILDDPKVMAEAFDKHMVPDKKGKLKELALIKELRKQRRIDLA